MPRAIIGFEYDLVAYIRVPDHNPPHIHIKRKRDTLASVEIRNPRNIVGKGLTPNERRHVKKIVEDHADKLLEMWKAAQNHKPFDPIKL